MVSTRKLALEYIDSALDKDPTALAKEHQVILQADKLKPEDRGLFQELGAGVLREWGFLNWVCSQRTKQKPKRRVQQLLALGAYQLIFLDRVPAYAIFAESQNLAKEYNVSDAEQKFVHGVLKSIEKEAGALRVRRDQALEALLSTEQLPQDDLEWAVLNAPASLLDALTVVDSGLNKKAARLRGVRALATMKIAPPFLGYAMPGGSCRSKATPYLSRVAPRALLLEAGATLTEDLQSGAVRIQGEASQWACEKAADQLEKLSAISSGRVLQVCELAAGKGGKLLGTLSAWTAKRGQNPGAVPRLVWQSFDRSEAQLEILKRDALPLVKRCWPQVEVICTRAEEEDLPQVDQGSYDLVWLDAPCTGFGTLAKLPQISLRWGESAYDHALELGSLQKQLCAQAKVLLKPMGRFFYTVCTLTRPETHEVVKRCESLFERAPLFTEALWPGAKPAPRSEGFFSAMF
ncbi:MAG: transcription antitermination factor NusB [Bdellovibrionota bacterium]